MAAIAPLSTTVSGSASPPSQVAPEMRSLPREDVSALQAQDDDRRRADTVTLRGRARFEETPLLDHEEAQAVLGRLAAAPAGDLMAAHGDISPARLARLLELEL